MRALIFGLLTMLLSAQSVAQDVSCPGAIGPEYCPENYVVPGVHPSRDSVLRASVVVRSSRSVDFDGDGPDDEVLRVSRTWTSRYGRSETSFCVYAVNTAAGWRGTAALAINQTFPCAETVHVGARDLLLYRSESVRSDGREVEDDSSFEISEVREDGTIVHLWEGEPRDGQSGFGWTFSQAASGMGISVVDRAGWTTTLVWDSERHRYSTGEWQPPAHPRPNVARTPRARRP